jgi:AraC-like DNA-binding protein
MRYLNLKLLNTKLMMKYLAPHSADPIIHDHGDDFQISLPITGSPFLELDHKASLLGKNSIIVTAPGEKHIHFSEEDESKILLINMNKDFLNKVVSSRLAQNITEVELLSYVEGSFEEIVKMADKIIREGLLKDIDPIKIEELEWELAEVLLTSLEGSHTKEWRSEVLLNQYPLIKNIVHYIHENYTKEIALEDLVRISGLSKFYLLRLFKETMGNTPSHYISIVRLKKAEELLLTTNASVTNICYEIGYGSLPSFERAFRKKYGVTITEFRKTNRF